MAESLIQITVSHLHMVTFQCNASLENMVVTGFHMLDECIDTRCCLTHLSLFLKSIQGTNILHTAVVGESLREGYYLHRSWGGPAALEARWGFL